jgi:O-antigen ligase
VIFTAVFLPVLSNTTWFQQGVLRKGNLAIRESYWTLAKPLITDSPAHLIFGHGVDSLTSQSSSGGPGVGISQSLSTAPTLTTIGPHNQFVRVLLEQGLVGILLVAGWLGGACVGAVARIRAVPAELRPVLAALVGATVGFALVASASDSMRHPPSLAVIALISGTLVTVTGLVGKREGQGGIA